MGLSASFAAFCLLLPAALRYIGFAIEIAYVLDATSRIDATASMPQEQRTAAWVGAALTHYHLPDACTVLTQAVPVELMPQQIVWIVSDFLTEGDVDVTRMTIAEGAKWRSTE